MVKVETASVYDDFELKEQLEEFQKDKDYGKFEIISVSFIGYNTNHQRLYTVVMEKE